MIYLNSLPSYKNSTNFSVSYTAIETDQLAVKVNLFIQKEGKDWRQTKAKDMTGYAGEFQIEGGDIYDNEGRYNFKAIAESGGRTLESNIVFTTLDMSPPSAPTEYGKERVNPTTYKLTWKNPYDSDFEKVYVYRSKEKSFTADSGTRIGEVGGAKDEKITFNDGAVPEPNIDYYYALRALDHAGNASGVVTDAPGTIVNQVLGTTSGQSSGTGGKGEVVLLPKEEEITDLTENEGELGGAGATEGDVKGENTPKSRSLYIFGGLGLLLIIGAFFKFRKSQD